MMPTVSLFLREDKVRQCRFCQAELLGGNKRVYCNDDCSNKYHIRDKSNKIKAKNKLLPIRFCKYELCKKQLPIGENRKVYCRNTECSQKQNAIEAKRKRDGKEKKKEINRKCENIKCDKSFAVQPQRPRQLYCCGECRRTATTKPRTATAKPRGKAVEKIKVPKKFLKRGKIHYEGHR